MQFKAVIFDFDGTLVDSVAAKYDAFFPIFPDSAEHRRIVTEVLAEDPDGSRYTVIPRMVQRMQASELALPPGHDAANRIEAYARTVLEAVAQCREMPGATDILRTLRNAGYPVFISSNTPQEPLRDLVSRRGWSPLLADVFGYPCAKVDTVRDVLRRFELAPQELAIVGDGTSDERAARSTGAAFFAIRDPRDLAKVATSWGLQPC